MARESNPLGRLPVRRIRVRGPSMAPTLRDGDVVLARRGVARAGDVVVVTWPQRPGQLSVKRAARHVAPRSWFVVGDNDLASTDSRELGAATVHAVVRWRLWPRPRRLPPPGA